MHITIMECEHKYFSGLKKCDTCGLNEQTAYVYSKMCEMFETTFPDVNDDYQFYCEKNRIAFDVTTKINYVNKQAKSDYIVWYGIFVIPTAEIGKGIAGMPVKN